MEKIFSKKAQSTLEYAILIFVVIGALIAMQTYVKRGYQGKLRESTEQMGEQYSPGYTSSTFTTTRDSKTNETVINKVSTNTITQNTQDRTGNESVQALKNESWPE